MVIILIIIYKLLKADKVIKRGLFEVEGNLLYSEVEAYSNIIISNIEKNNDLTDIKKLMINQRIYIKEGEKYPATLVTTADHDDRVVPAHSFKFIATLQEKHRGKNPVLIRIETRSGHGSSSTSKAIDIITDKWSFMFYSMGIKVKY